MSVRRARTEDADALTALTMASKQSNGYDDAFMAACAEELRVHPADIAAHSYWVAETDEPVGCVCLSVHGKVGTINAFFIHPSHKRKGIGRALWNVVMQAARESRLNLLQLDADPEAVPFYKAIGFATVSEAPSGSIPGRMLPHMHLHLKNRTS